MDKKQTDAAREINEVLGLIPQIPVGKTEMMERLREMKTWIGMEEVLAEETVGVIRGMK